MKRIQIDAADLAADEAMLRLEDDLANPKLNTTYKTLSKSEPHKSIEAQAT